MRINPSKILCLGTNYLDHIEETKLPIPKEPIIFPKLPSCLTTHDQPIIYPKKLYENRKWNRVDYEVELAFIIGKQCKNVKAKDAFDYILGYSVFNDVTARKMQIKDITSRLPWFRSKSFDTFGPIGPKIIPYKDIKEPHNLDIELRVNDEIKQSSNTKHLLFKIPEILEYISQMITLESGDIIATGTPAGIGPIKPGDVIEAEIEKIGILSNIVKLEK
jgi:2-keto-4-pentenoate hydratase/2-oxohepta-3-ene-1,7-dioic acid hydratase in catechol pathway